MEEPIPKMKNGNTDPGGVEALAGRGCPGLQWCAKTHRLKPLLQHGRFPGNVGTRNSFWGSVQVLTAGG